MALKRILIVFFPFVLISADTLRGGETGIRATNGAATDSRLLRQDEANPGAGGESTRGGGRPEKQTHSTEPKLSANLRVDGTSDD